MFLLFVQYRRVDIIGSRLFLRLPGNRSLAKRCMSYLTLETRLEFVEWPRIGVILLAGGVGKRMNLPKPKQYYSVLGREIIEYSLDLFRTIQNVSSIVVVADEAHQSRIWDMGDMDERIIFASPGPERQDSVRNGLDKLPSICEVVVIHDAARPCITREAVSRVIDDGVRYGAAILATPVKSTIKESDDGSFVSRTLIRSKLWEAQTPQVIKVPLLKEAFSKLTKGSIVTDDASLIEESGGKVKLTLGEYTNLKVSTPDDLSLVEQILDNGAVQIV